MSTDPRTGFTVRNSLTDEEWQAEQAERRAAAQPEPMTGFGTVGQGHRGEVTPSGFTTAQLGDFSFYQAHKAEILAAQARNELPGQGGYTTTPLND